MPRELSQRDQTCSAISEPLHPERIVESLTHLPILAQCSRQELTRMLPYLSLKHMQPGESLCHAGQPAQETWLLLRGTLWMDGARGDASEVCEGFVGEEAALGASTYMSDIRAKDEATVLVLPREVLPAALRHQDSRESCLWRSLLERFTARTFSLHMGKVDSSPPTRSTGIFQLIGWVAAMVLPFIILRCGAASGLRWEQTQMAAALASGAMLWMFHLTPPYVAGLFLVLVSVTLGIVPTKVILSGFTSNGFFMALSVFGIGAVLLKSGLILRAVLLVVRYCPRTPFWHDLTAMLTGIILTPILPSAQARARALAPLLADSSHSVGHAMPRPDVTRLALSVFMGATLFSPVLLTGGPLNLALYGSLPEQVQHGFPWLHWAIAAAVAAVIMLVAYTSLSLLVFHKASKPQRSHETIRAQLTVLGPMSGTEWMALGGVVVFFAAVLTPSGLKIDHRLIALIILCIYLVMDVLKSDQINVDIDWSFLVLLGTLIGLVNTIAYVDLDTLGAAHLTWLSQTMQTQPRLFIAILSIIVVMSRLVIPAAGALVALFFLPLAIVNGIHPWVVTFVILMMHDCWLLPYQSSAYQTFRTLVRLHHAYDERLFLKVNAATAAIRIVAIIVSLFYWEQMHML